MAGAIRIGRLRAECEVAATADAATAALGDVTRRAVATHLAPTLRGAFGPWLDRPEESVWVVRRVECAVHVGADAPPDAIASSVASALGRALGDALTGDGDGVDTIRFPSRAAYLARFVVDAAAGDAWRRWYHAAFRGLAPLPTSAAIRTALAEDPARGMAALAGLDDAALAAVGGALTRLDERALLDALAADGDDGADDEAAFAVAWSGCARAWRAAGERGRALFAFVRSDGAHHGATVARATWQLLDAMSSLDAVRRSATLPSGPSVPAEDPLADVPAAVARAARATVHAATPTAPGEAEGSAFTRFGGAFLLLAALDGLPWDEWTADWPAIATMRASDALRWLTVARCAGAPHAADVLEDGVVRALFGVPRDASASQICEWLRGLGRRRRAALDAALADEWTSHADYAATAGVRASPTADERAWLALSWDEALGRAWRAVLARAARLVLARLARRLPGFAESSPAHLWRNFLDFPATVEYGGDDVVVRCGRPPLHLVLSLTGLVRGTRAGRDARGRDVFLYPDD